MKKLEDLNLLDNFLFHEVVCSEEYGEEFCRMILGTILNREIGHVKVEVEKTYLGMSPEGHGVRLDAVVTEESGEEKQIFDLEPNLYSMEDPGRRGRYYHAVLAQRNLNRGELYRRLPDVYVIFILPYDPFGQGKMLYTMETTCREMPDLPYDDGQHTIFLYTKGKGLPGKSLESMLHFIQETKSENITSDMLKRMSEMVEAVKRDKKVGVRYMSWRMYVEDARQDAQRKGMEDGLEQGLEQGLRQGIEQGIERGIEQGIERGIRALVRTCAQVGMSKAQTATQLSEEMPDLHYPAMDYVNRYWDIDKKGQTTFSETGSNVSPDV